MQGSGFRDWLVGSVGLRFVGLVGLPDLVTHRFPEESDAVMATDAVLPTSAELASADGSSPDTTRDIPASSPVAVMCPCVYLCILHVILFFVGMANLVKTYIAILKQREIPTSSPDANRQHCL